LEFLAGKKKEASKDIEAAMKLEGTDRMKDNARVLKLYITGAQAKPSDEFDEYLITELQWLKGKKEEDGFFQRALTRISHQIIVPHYEDKPEQQLSMMLVTNNYQYGYRIDTMPVEQLEKFYFYTKTPAKTALDKYLKKNIETNDSDLVELIGTRYMRNAQWDKAIQWLKDIPVAYYNQNRSDEYLYYSRMRSYEVEPWIKRQWLDSDKAYEKKIVEVARLERSVLPVVGKAEKLSRMRWESRILPVHPPEGTRDEHRGCRASPFRRERREPRSIARRRAVRRPTAKAETKAARNEPSLRA
jgi:hypothetical protein